MYVLSHSQTSDYANVGWFIIQHVLSDMKITMMKMMMTFQSHPMTLMKTFISPQKPCPSPCCLIPMMMTTFQLHPTTWMKTFIAPQIPPPLPCCLIPMTACPPPVLMANLWVQITLPGQSISREIKECSAWFLLPTLPIHGTAIGVQSPTGLTNSCRSVFLLSMTITLLLLLRQLLSIAQVITECTLLMSETGLKNFVQLLLFRLNKGILFLEDGICFVTVYLTKHSISK